MKRFAYGAFIGGFFTVVTLTTFYLLYAQQRIWLKLSTETLTNSLQSMKSEQSLLSWHYEIDQSSGPHKGVKRRPTCHTNLAVPRGHCIVCNIVNLSNWRTDAYELIGDLRLDTISSTIFITCAPQQNHPSSFSIRPYARKADMIAMKGVTEFKINYKSTQHAPQCHQNMMDIPAVIFSTGGYTGNYFHTFTDVLLPLFTASRRFNGSAVFLISDNNPEWMSKYKVVLDKLSNYRAYDLDRENRVLCFSSIIIGLRARREFTIDQQATKLSNRNFTNFLRNAYTLDRQSVSPTQRLRMLIITRRKVRQLVNEHDVSDMARRLGFEVVLKRMAWNVSLVAKLVNSFDVLVGVHGAGLTNMVFLPEKAIVVQIVPFGLELLSKNCFQKPAEEMNLRYLEYRAGIKEGLLSGKFLLDSNIYGDPEAVNEKGFDAFRSVYLDNQDIKIDVGRFRSTLLKALEILTIN